MINSGVHKGSIIPKSFLSRLNDFSLGSEDKMRTNPVCLAVEYNTVTVEDLIDQAGFSTSETVRRRHS